MSLAASNPAAELEGLRTERARLISLLESHGIEWRLPPKAVEPVGEPEPSTLSTDEKVTLFRRLFRGRTDLCPVRWENSTTGKSGYSPSAPMTGVPAFARNRASSVRTATIAK